MRISVGASWGTGFAIAPHRVLTSLHAVGKLDEGRLALHGDEVEIAAKITDSDGENDMVRFPACVCTLDDVADFDAELGWIVFDVDSETFAGIAIPPLAAATPSHNSVRWTTYGFPDPDADLGEPGAVTAAIGAQSTPSRGTGRAPPGPTSTWSSVKSPRILPPVLLGADSLPPPSLASW